MTEKHKSSENVYDSILAQLSGIQKIAEEENKPAHIPMSDTSTDELINAL